MALVLGVTSYTCSGAALTFPQSPKDKTRSKADWTVNCPVGTPWTLLSALNFDKRALSAVCLFIVEAEVGGK